MIRTGKTLTTRLRLRSLRMAVAFAAVVFSLPATAQRAFDADILVDTFGINENTKRSVALEDLKQGCSTRDCIRSIDNPRYVLAKDVDHVADDDVVLALSWKGYHRAWPANILDQHEIVNDFVAGTPIAITWCPLCGSAVGVIREINGQTTEFGVSGLLYNSDLVFYDRMTNTLWDQIEAKGIVGPLTDTELELVPVTVTRWGKWKTAHPDTAILSADTGFANDYSRDVYAGYRGRDRLMFPVANTSDAIRPKSPVYGFVIEGHEIAVTDARLDRTSKVEHTIAGRLFDLRREDDGAVTLTDRESGEVHSSVRMFWFAWYTFHPETELVD